MSDIINEIKTDVISSSSSSIIVDNNNNDNDNNNNDNEMTDEEKEALLFKQIMTLDLNSLLDSVTLLKESFQQYDDDDDKLPGWASGVSSRLDVLEQAKKFNIGADRIRQTGKKNDSYEDKLLKVVIAKSREVLGLAQTNLNVRVAAVTNELDRLHKLTEIRPTAADLQKLVKEIHSLEKENSQRMKDMQKTFRAQIQGRISAEMKQLVQSLEHNEKENDSQVDILKSKVSDFFDNLSRTRLGMGNEFKEKNDAYAAVYKSQDDNVNEFNETKEIHDKYFKEIHDIREGIKSDMTKDGAELEQFKIDDENTRKEQYDYLNKLKCQINILLEKCDSMHNQMENDLNSTNQAVNSLKEQYDLVLKEINVVNSDFIRQYDKWKQDQDNVHEFVLLSRKLNIQTKLKNHSEQMIRDREHSVETEEMIDTINTKIQKLLKTYKEIRLEYKKLPDQLAEEDKRCQTICESQESFESTLYGLQKTLNDANANLDEMLELRDDIHKMSARIKVAERNMETYEATLIDLVEKSEKRSDNLKAASLSIESGMDNLELTLEKLEESMLADLINKHEHYEIVFKNIRDNLALITEDKSVEGALSIAGSSIDGSGVNQTEVFSNLSDHDKRQLINQCCFEMASLCMYYEEVSVRDNFVRDMTTDMCKKMTNNAQMITQFFAHTADAEVVKRSLRGQPNETHYEENAVEDLRKSKVNSFVEEIRMSVTTSSKAPGTIRLQARDRFFTQLNKALDLCMSKHAQVIVVGLSRFGRIKIPTSTGPDITSLNKIKSTKVKPFIKGLSHLTPNESIEVHESIEDMIKAKQKAIAPSVTSTLDGFEGSENSIVFDEDLIINDDISQGGSGEMLGNINDMMNVSPKQHKTRIQRQFNELRGVPIASRSLEFQNMTPTLSKNNDSVVTPYVLRGGFKMTINKNVSINSKTTRF